MRRRAVVEKEEIAPFRGRNDGKLPLKIDQKTRPLGSVNTGENDEEEILSQRWVIDWKGHSIREQFPWTRSIGER